VGTINGLFQDYDVPTRLENFASIFYLHFPVEMKLASLFYYYLRHKGLHIWEGFPCFISTAHTDRDFDRVENAFSETILDMQRGGFLPERPEKASSEAPDRADRPAALSKVPALPGSVDAGEHGWKRTALTEAQKEIWYSAQVGGAPANC